MSEILVIFSCTDQTSAAWKVQMLYQSFMYQIKACPLPHNILCSYLYWKVTCSQSRSFNSSTPTYKIWKNMISNFFLHGLSIYKSNKEKGLTNFIVLFLILDACPSRYKSKQNNSITISHLFYLINEGGVFFTVCRDAMAWYVKVSQMQRRYLSISL